MDRDQLAARASEVVHEIVAAAERRAEEIVAAAERRAEEIVAAAEGRAAEMDAPAARTSDEEPPREAAARDAPAGPDEMGAKIVALKLAKDGASRDEIVAGLDERLPDEARARIADEMLARVRG